MKALVCGNCGSSLEVKKDNEGVIVCAYCGRETTLPKYTIAPEVAITLQMAETEMRREIPTQIMAQTALITTLTLKIKQTSK